MPLFSPRMALEGASTALAPARMPLKRPAMAVEAPSPGGQGAGPRPVSPPVRSPAAPHPRARGRAGRCQTPPAAATGRSGAAPATTACPYGTRPRGAVQGGVALRMGLVGRGIGSRAGGRRSRHGKRRRSAPTGGLGHVSCPSEKCSNSPSCSREGGRVLEHGARPARRFPREGLVSLRTPGHR